MRPRKRPKSTNLSLEHLKRHVIFSVFNISNKDPSFQQGKEGLSDLNRLLQDVDLQRIKGIVYRDMVVSIVYDFSFYRAGEKC